MAMNLEPARHAVPKESGMGRRSTIRQRADYMTVIADCVLQRHSYVDIAKRCNVTTESLQRFRDKFITDEVRKLIILADQRDAKKAIDDEINAGQDDIQHGLRSIITEQKSLYQMLRERIDADGNSIEDLIPALATLLRDQGQSFDRLLKSYTALQEKTTIILGINESPEWSKLQDVLFAVFEQHPEAFETFRGLSQERKLRLE